MRKGVLHARPGVAVLIAISFLFAAFATSAAAKKHKDPNLIPGVNDHFLGVMNPQKKPTMSDPLWERYAFAGKKMLERHDVSMAQRYYWATCLELEAINKQSPLPKFDEEERNVLTDTFVLSRDVFFEDPNPANMTDTPPAFPQPILPETQPLVDAQMQKLINDQNAFDQKHRDFDGGARLRMTHLRRRIEFETRLLPVMQNLLGTDDSITKIVTDHLNNDTREMKDVSTEG